MAGHIQKRGKDSYLLVYPMGYDQNGKRIRKTKTVKAKNQTEAKKQLAAFVTEVETGSYVAPSHTRFADYVKLWRKDAAKKVAPKTIETYDYVLNKRIVVALGHFKMEDISHVHITDLIESLASNGLSSATIQKHYNVLSSIFKLAVRNEMIQKNPMEKVDKPSVTYKAGNVYNSDELRQLFQIL
ncbi:phage integrase SAM-like domain-containing protein, partial [Microvirga sp. 3-52]|nr:phage integrase SAM-like domain-containing protein [Microvirga sp. 3-52]